MPDISDEVAALIARLVDVLQPENVALGPSQILSGPGSRPTFVPTTTHELAQRKLLRLTDEERRELGRLIAQMLGEPLPPTLAKGSPADE